MKTALTATGLTVSLLDGLGLGGLLGTPTGFGSQQGYATQNPWAQQNMTAQQYNQTLQGIYQQRKPDWVFNGVTYSARDFADAVWPDDCAEKTAFVLKYVK